MTDPMLYRARVVVPLAGRPIENGVVEVADGRIMQTQQSPPDGSAMDLGDVALVPGLVNAHTHLEFSDLSAPLGFPGIGFPQWIGAVIEHRQKRAATEGCPDPSQVIAQGAAEAMRSGTTAVGEIATIDWPPAGVPSLMMVAFRELLGLGEERERALLETARSHLDAQGEFPEGCLAGLSPHAPYTVSLELLEQACRLSQSSKAPVAMHLAESWEEMELLASGSGPLVEFLSSLGAWRAGAVPRGVAPRDYLERLAAAHRALVVHGTFLASDDWRLLAEHADRMCLVHCPRTHDFFDRGRYPLSEMLAAGIRMALGTDSRASNPDLNMLAEVKHLARRHADVSPEAIVRMATIDGATALGLAAEAGSLTPGRRADMVAIRLAKGPGKDPFEAMLDDESQAVAVWSKGELVWAAEGYSPASSQR